MVHARKVADYFPQARIARITEVHRRLRPDNDGRQFALHVPVLQLLKSIFGEPYVALQEFFHLGVIARQIHRNIWLNGQPCGCVS
jgi:hypothetical protein